uniref:Succinate:cytochrome c oxidoreductase subunit 4 n=1 Tax=Entransia fimbriata TaxID=130991 RepID=U5YF22_9VIRI|nr:succinate:cytochrome c oxidoreductase subunit 4 [Entransia fimbriata]AGZ90312.1 succinate:cytochrome c oxidoreductase subunit 4 [Entransia fimbriata]
MLSHWLIQRFTAFFLFCFLITPRTELFFIFNIVLFAHVFLGVSEILADYVHNENTKLFAAFLLKVLCLLLAKEFYASLFF